MPFKKDDEVVATVDDITEIKEAANISIKEELKASNLEHLFIKINALHVRRVIELWETLKKSGDCDDPDLCPFSDEGKGEWIPISAEEEKT